MIAEVLDTTIIVLLVLLIAIPVGMAATRTIKQKITRRR